MQIFVKTEDKHSKLEEEWKVTSLNGVLAEGNHKTPGKVLAGDGRNAAARPLLGPGKVFVGVLGMGVPRLACLRPAAWLKEWPSMAHLHQHMLKTLARGQASRGRTAGGFLGHGLVMLAREEAERSRRGTSRGAREIGRAHV